MPFRVNNKEPVRGPHQQNPAVIADGGDLLESGHDGYRAEPLVTVLDAGHLPCSGPDPQAAAPILMNGRYVGAGIRQLDPAKRWTLRKAAGSIEHAEADFGADPKPLFPVQEQAIDDSIGERIRGFSGPEDLERLTFRVVYIQPAPARSDPDLAAGIFGKAEDEITADGARIVRVGAEDAERISVIPVQAVFRSKPEKVSTVLKGAENGALGEPLFDREASQEQRVRKACPAELFCRIQRRNAGAGDESP